MTSNLVKNIVIAVGATATFVVASFLLGSAPHSNSKPIQTNENKTIVQFTKQNLVILQEEVTQSSMDRVIDELYQKDTKEPIYLYIDSPGGDVYAGLRLAQYLKATNQNIVCVANEAASMGFYILENCKTRLSTENPFLLAHNIAGPLPQGATLPQLRLILKDWEATQDSLNRVMAERIGVTLDFFRDKVSPELNMGWSTRDGKEAVALNFVDAITFPICSKELFVSKRTVQVAAEGLEGALGKTVAKKVSGCPL